MTSQTVLQIIIIRSSRSEGLCKIGVLRNFAKFKGKHLCWGLYFKKVADLSPATLLKMSVQHWCFPKFLRTPFFTEHLRCLLLNNAHIIQYSKKERQSGNKLQSVNKIKRQKYFFKKTKQKMRQGDQFQTFFCISKKLYKSK